MSLIPCALCGTQNISSASLCAACGASLEDAAASHALTYEALGAGATLQSGAIVLEGVLGQGGFGITYRGFDVLDGRAVAVKEFFPYGCVRRGARVQPSSMLEEAEFVAARRAFADESGWLLCFRHPNIVSVLSVFEENNSAYLVMELLEGQTLEQMIAARGALPEGEALIYIEQVALALETLHGADLLHRDIKPENIMVCGPRVVLLDFGAARSFSGGGTRRMTSVLTPGYAPLEQYGTRARFGRFTDIYALGATLYHLLTGQMPPSATDRVSGTPLKSPSALNPNISQLTSSAVEWALQIKVDERPQNVSDWIRALRSGYRPASEPVAVAAPINLPPAPVVPDPARRAWLNESLSKAGRRIGDWWHMGAPATGGTLPRDWHRVTIEAKRIKWPAQCVCCGAPTRAFWPMPTSTATWEIPHCPPCREHVERGHSMQGVQSSLLWVCATLFVVFGLGFKSLSALQTFGLVLPLALLLIGRIAARVLHRLHRARWETDCCDYLPAVRYRGRNGDIFSWDFRNRAYAEAFLKQNTPAIVADATIPSPTPEKVAALETKRAPLAS